MTGMIAVSVVMFLSAGCTGKTGSGHPEMADDPVGVYGNYLSEVRKLDDLSTKELAVHINRWRAARDSAFSHAIRDTSGNSHSDLYGRCERIHDSLRTEFIRLARSVSRTCQDVFVLKELTSPYYGDKDLKVAADNARPFFSSLDSTPPLDSDRNNILSAYHRLLARTLQDGIHDLTGLKSFIRNEDAHLSNTP